VGLNKFLAVGYVLNEGSPLANSVVGQTCTALDADPPEGYCTRSAHVG